MGILTLVSFKFNHVGVSEGSCKIRKACLVLFVVVRDSIFLQGRRGHACQLKEDPFENPILQCYPGTTYKRSLKRWFVRQVILDDTHPNSEIFKASKKMLYDHKIENMALLSESFRIHPFSKFRSLSSVKNWKITNKCSFLGNFGKFFTWSYRPLPCFISLSVGLRRSTRISSRSIWIFFGKGAFYCWYATSLAGPTWSSAAIQEFATILKTSTWTKKL